MQIKQKITLLSVSLISILLIGFALYFLHSALASNDWKKTKATVSGYEIKSKVKPNQKNYYNSKKKRKYRIEITYQYNFADSLYTSSKISFGKGNTLESGFYNYEDALSWLQNSNYAKNKSIEVYVNPVKPVESVVLSGLTFMTFIPLIIGIIFALAFFKLNKKYNSNIEDTL